jgi:hypothetical protein
MSVLFFLSIFLARQISIGIRIQNNNPTIQGKNIDSI